MTFTRKYGCFEDLYRATIGQLMDVDDVGIYFEALGKMAEELRQHGAHDAAEATKNIERTIEECATTISHEVERLREVWRIAEAYRHGKAMLTDLTCAVEAWQHEKMDDATPGESNPTRSSRKAEQT